jgi:glycogen(starch) synthase
MGFFVWEYPPALVGGLGTYADYITREFINMGHDVTVFTLNPSNLKTREVFKGVEIHRPKIADVSNVFPMFVTEDLRKWGTNIRFFNDIFIYNVLSSTKFINSIIKKEGYKFDIVCVHDWLSCIAGIIVKNETKLPVVFHVHSTEYGRSGGHGSEVVSHLETATAKTADRIITVSNAREKTSFDTVGLAPKSVLFGMELTQNGIALKNVGRKMLIGYGKNTVSTMIGA